MCINQNSVSRAIDPKKSIKLMVNKSREIKSYNVGKNKTSKETIAISACSSEGFISFMKNLCHTIIFLWMKLKPNHWLIDWLQDDHEQQTLIFCCMIVLSEEYSVANVNRGSWHAQPVSQIHNLNHETASEYFLIKIV